MAKRALLPEFIIGGAPRSGTVFMCSALDRHPAVYMAKPYTPEPKVFMGPPLSGAAYAARYEALFAQSPEGALLGEKTSYYLESGEACARIREHLPNVKLIFLVREPVARAYSNYLWSVKNGLETLSFEEAVEMEGRREDPFPPERSYVRPFDYLARGSYDRFARLYLDALGAERVRFFLYEDIASSPDRLMRDVQSYLGVEPVAFASLNPGMVNAARQTGPPIEPAAERRLRERCAPIVTRFRKLTGLDLSAWGYGD